MNAGVKNMLSGLFYKLGIWKAFIKTYPKLFKKPLLTVLTYHRVTNNTNHAEYIMPYEQGISKESFEKHVIWLKQCFEFIDLDRFIEILKNKQADPKAYALLTFDDGDSEFADAVLPILKKHDIPAVVFIPTHFLDTGKIFYNLKLTSLFNDIDDDGWKKIAQSNVPINIRDIINSFKDHWSENKYELRRKIGMIFFNMNEIDVEHIIDSWEKLTDHKYSLGVRCIDWDEAKKLTDAAICLQSHSVNHYRLDGLDDQQIEFELVESKHKIESELGNKVESICYPVGAYNERVIGLSKKSGYEIGFTTDSGLIDLSRSDDYYYMLPRISNGMSGGPADFIDLGNIVIQAFVKEIGTT